MNKKFFHLLIGLILIAFSLYYAFKGVTLSELTHALMSIHYLYLLPAIFLVFLSYLLKAFRWRYLILHVKKDIKISTLLSALLVGFMANMLPARAGEFVRAYLLSKKTQISFSSSFATIFIERLFDLIVLLLLIVWTLLFMPDALSPKGGDGGYQILEKVKIFGEISFLLCLFIVLFSALLQFKNDLAMKIFGFFIKPLPHKWKEKMLGLVHSFTEGLNIIRDKRGFTATVLLSLIIWAVFTITYYPLYMAFDIQGDLPAVSSSIVLCLMIAVFITLAPTPGFLGSYHLACVAALHGIYGIQKAVALSYGIVAWLVVMGSTVVVGLIYALKEHVSFGEFSAKGETVE